MSVRTQSAIADAIVQRRIAAGFSATRCVVRQHHRLEPHQILAAAAAGPVDVGDARRDRDLIRSAPAGRPMAAAAQARLAQPASASRSQQASASPVRAARAPSPALPTDAASAAERRRAARTGAASRAVGCPNSPPQAPIDQAAGLRAASAGADSAQSTSSRATPVTIAVWPQAKPPQGHLRRAFGALKFMTIP